ncbi:RHS repeat-associated core domain-containing protein [Pseudocolwellia agarivorans]|uniref:RHS repeat-associated core domain-containing protein n=1 Tax=Pseudocolwellia agarivorans TaxID=1911682 RepID=UPI0009860F9C|nr:RHS repeat-associated core domain-containing protein [Pseudocolwellia agarivorans]
MDVNKFHFRGYNRHVIILPRSSSAPAGYTLAATENTNNGQELVNEISPDIAKNVNALDHAFGLLAMVGISVNKTARQIASKLLEAINQNRLSVYTENDKTSLYYSNETNSSSGSAPSTSSAKTPNVNQSNQGKKSLNSSEAGSSSNNTATEVPIADQECRSDPISMLSGEEILPLIDFELNGLMPIVWRRLYRSSKIKQNLGLGYGWRHNYSMQLVQKYQEPPKVGPKQPGRYWLELTDEEGRLHVFDKVKRGQTSYQLSSGLALVHQADGSHTLIKSDDSHWTFTEQVTKSINETSSTRQSSRKKKEQPQPTWLLQSISNNQGQYIQLNYDDKQRLVELSPGPKRGIKLQYNVDNNIIRIAAYYIDEHNKTHVHNNLLANYQYDDSQALIAATNSSGNVERYTYHKQRVELYSEDAKTAIKPQLSYLLKKRTRSSGFSHHFEWQGTDENAQCIKQWGDNDTYQYRFKFFTDERGKVSTSTDSNGNTETFIHNEQGLLTAFTNANGHTSYNEYDSAGRKVKAIDCQGNVTEFSYNQQGQLSLVITPDGAITRYLYNGLGKRISTIDPLGQETKRIFDGTGRLISEIMPDGRSRRYEYTLAGLLRKKTDLSGVITQYHWDNTGELLAKKIGNTLTRFSYNTLGLLIATVDSQGLITQFNRNEQGQITEQISYSQSTPDDKITQRYVYDESGRLTSHEFVEAIQTNKQTESTEQTSYQYDGLAQPSQKTFSDGSWLKYQYDKERNLTAIERSDGATYQLEYSPTEKPTKLIGFDGREQVYTYDANDKLISVADNGERFIRLKRDSLGRIIEQTSAGRNIGNSSVNSKEHHKAGARTASVNNAELRNTHNFYQYDKLSRITRAHNSERTVTQQYHQNGQISTSQQGAWQLDYTYNDKGQRQSVKLPDNTTLHYSYTEQGQLSGITYQQSEQDDESIQSLMTRQYNAAGLVIQQTLGNGIELTQQFDVFSRLAEQKWQSEQKNFSELRTYQYDKKHQLINVCSVSGNTDEKATKLKKKAFTYNSISQLLNTTITSEPVAQTSDAQATIKISQEQYQWDAFGNPLNVKEDNVDNQATAQAVNAENVVRPNFSAQEPKAYANNEIKVENDRLLSFLGTDYRYDGSGNQLTSLAKGEHQQRSFNGLNQLKSININGQLTHYEYDALGRRSAKITEQGRIDYIWDENQVIGEHFKGQFTWYIYQPNTFEPIALIKSSSGNQNNEIYYYHLDQLGTPLCLTNSKTQQVWRNESDAFGYQKELPFDKKNHNKQCDVEEDINLISNSLRFQGQYFDEESKLHYNRFRYYCSKQQRFIHQDPIGLVGGINHYQYAPNPVNWVDPFGLSCKEINTVVQKHLDNLPANSYELLDVVDRYNQGFSDNIAAKIKLLAPIEGVRFSGGGSNPAGPYVAIGDMPSSRYDTRQKLALKNFGNGAYNKMTHYTNVSMDKGTVMFIGDVAPQSSKSGKQYSGGGTQAFVEFWQPENRGKVHFSEPVKMSRHKIDTKGNK